MVGDGGWPLRQPVTSAPMSDNLPTINIMAAEMAATTITMLLIKTDAI